MINFYKEFTIFTMIMLSITLTGCSTLSIDNKCENGIYRNNVCMNESYYKNHTKVKANNLENKFYMIRDRY